MSDQVSLHWQDLRLHHQTLNTGHVLEHRLTEMTQYRPGTQVCINAVRPLQRHMSRLLANELIPAQELLPAAGPESQAYSVRGFPDFGVTRPVFAVYGHPEWSSRMELTQDTDELVPLVTFAVGVQGDTGHLWRYLCRALADEAAQCGNLRGLRIHDTIDPESPPATPWCAVWMHLPLLLRAYPDALDWLGNFERCVAWAAVLHAGAAGPIPPGKTGRS